MKLRVLHDFVQIEPLDPETSHGGIYLPSAYRDDTSNRNDFIRKSNQWCRGRVLGVGIGRKSEDAPGGRTEPDLSKGQLVYYKRAEATPLDDGSVIVHEVSIAFELKGGAA